MRVAASARGAAPPARAGESVMGSREAEGEEGGSIWEQRQQAGLIPG